MRPPSADDFVQVDGVDDHVHIVTSLPRTLSQVSSRTNKEDLFKMDKMLMPGDFFFILVFYRGFLRSVVRRIVRCEPESG